MEKKGSKKVKVELKQKPLEQVSGGFGPHRFCPFHPHGQPYGRPSFHPNFCSHSRDHFTPGPQHPPINVKPHR